jgi:Rrf2 family protein
VNLSARTQYACTAVLDLALQYHSGQPVQIRRIAESHGIPARFLVQILLQLKSAGLVTSTRGASGGYRLSRPPNEISLGEVMNLIEGVNSQPNENGAAPSPVTQVLQKHWHKIHEVEQKTLAATTFSDLADQVQRSGAPMYYI